MTNKEAIKKLEELCEYKGYKYTVITNKDVEALHKAIEALNCKESLEKKNEFLMQQIRLWQATEQQGSDYVENKKEAENETSN